MAEIHQRARNRNDLSDGHPIQPIHEVDQVHKPKACQQKQTAFDPERTGRNDPDIAGHRKEDRADRDRLQYQSRQYRDGFDVVRKSHNGHEQRRRENRGHNVQIHRICVSGDGARDDQGGADHRDAGPLWRWNPMR